MARTKTAYWLAPVGRAGFAQSVVQCVMSSDIIIEGAWRQIRYLDDCPIPDESISPSRTLATKAQQTLESGGDVMLDLLVDSELVTLGVGEASGCSYVNLIWPKLMRERSPSGFDVLRELRQALVEATHPCVATGLVGEDPYWVPRSVRIHQGAISFQWGGILEYLEWMRLSDGYSLGNPWTLETEPSSDTQHDVIAVHYKDDLTESTLHLSKMSDVN